MPVFMAAIISALWAGLSRILATRGGQWVATALAALGISFFTNEVVLDPVINLVSGAFSSVPASVMEWVRVLRFPEYVSIILSAYAAGGIKRAIMTRRAS